MMGRCGEIYQDDHAPISASAFDPCRVQKDFSDDEWGLFVQYHAPVPPEPRAAGSIFPRPPQAGNELPRFRGVGMDPKSPKDVYHVVTLPG